MPNKPYNEAFTRRKSGYIFDLDCRTSGSVKSAGVPGETHTYSAVVTTDEAIEAGECISMVRVPRGFTVTDAALFCTATALNVVLGLGDPFACGRLLGPIMVGQGTGIDATSLPEGTHTCVQYVRLSKIGRGGDGCGYGYTYTCDTDLVVTVGYGQSGFGIGGSTKTTGAVSTGQGGIALPSGAVIGVSVTGFIQPTITNTA